MSIEKLYNAVKSGRVKIEDLNEEGKRALREYILSKNPTLTESKKEIQKPLVPPPEKRDYKKPKTKSADSLPNLDPEFAEKHPILNKALSTISTPLRAVFENPWVKRAGQTGLEIMLLTDRDDKVSTGSKAGDVTADLVGGILGFGAGPASAGSQLFSGGAKAAEKLIPRLPQPTSKVVQTLVKEGTPIAGGSVAFEAGMAGANERPISPTELGMAAGANVALDFATRGLVRGLPKVKKTQTKTVSPLIPEPQSTQKTASEIGETPDTTSHIVSKTEKQPFNLSRMLNNLYTKNVDNLYRINELDKYVTRTTGKHLSPEDKAHMLALNSRGSDVISSHILEERLVDAKGNVVGDSLASITKQVPKNKVKEFEDYLIHRHAPTWMEKGRKVFAEEYGITPEISKAKVAEYEAKHPEFKKIADELRTWMDKFYKSWLVDSPGAMLTKEQWQTLREMYPDYVPMRRQMQDVEQTLSSKAKRGFANQPNPIKRATGSERPIVSPLESIIEDVNRIVKTVKRNEVMSAIIRNLKKDPEAFKGWAEIVPSREGLLEDINKVLKEEGIDGVVEKFNQPFDEVFKRTQKLNRPNIVTGIVNGNRVHVKVNDLPLLEALTNLSPQGRSAVIEATRQVTRHMKNLTTGINPVFSLARNIFRDIPMAYIASKSTNNPVTFAKDLVEAIVSVLKNGELYKSFKAVGGGHASSISADRNLLAESKARILPRYIDFKQPAQASKRIASKGISYLERLNNAIEAAPRLAEFKRVSRGDTYGDKIRGLYEANDVTVNFKRYGNLSREVDAIVPYFNAAIQGIDKFGRIYKDNPTQAILKSFLAITVPTIMLYAINHNNPNYQKLSNYVKDSYFLFPKDDGTFIKIPKPRETGVVFGSLVERLLRAWKDQDPEAFEKFSNTIWANFMFPTRTIAHPVLRDLPSNRDFAGRTIVPGYMEKLSPELQYDEKTSKPAKFIGEKLNVSPKQIDYLARSYLGVVGQLGIPATTEGSSVGETLKRQVTADPLYSNDVMSKFYDIKKKLDTARADYKVTKTKSADYNARQRKLFNNAADRISEIRKRIRKIEKNKAIPQQEKEKKIRELQAKMLDIAQYRIDHFK